MPPPAGRPRHPDVLTPAEWRVLDHVREGRANAEIAVRLGVSVNTVRTHVSSMLAKLELADRHALAAWDGRPKRRFGFLPSAPPIALGVSFARGATIAGGAAAAAAVVTAIILATNGDAEEAQTSMLVQTEVGLIGMNPATGAPLANLTVFGGGDEPSGLVDHGGGLLWLRSGGPPGSASEIIALDGSSLGLESSGLRHDRAGVVQRWVLPDSDRGALLGSFAATPDGRTAYVTRRVLPDFTSGIVGPPLSELWKLEIDEDDPTLVTTELELGRLLVSHRGGLFLDHSLPPALTRIDPDDGSEIDRIEIAAPRGGSFLAPDARHLFLIGGDEGQVVIVDLDQFAVIDRLSLPPRTPTEGFPWNTALTSDRTRLYLAGDDYEACEDEVVPEGLEPACVAPPLGVQTIDLQTMERLYNDPTHNRLALSPDSRWLVTTLSTVEPGPRQPYRPLVGDGVKIVDTRTFSVVAHLGPGSLHTFPAISGDSRYAYTVSPGPGFLNERRWEECLAECSTITVIDLDLPVPAVIASHHYDTGPFFGFLQRVP